MRIFYNSNKKIKSIRGATDQRTFFMQINLEISYKQCLNLIVLLKKQNETFVTEPSSKLPDIELIEFYKKMLEENKDTIKQIENLLS